LKFRNGNVKEKDCLSDFVIIDKAVKIYKQLLAGQLSESKWKFIIVAFGIIDGRVLNGRPRVL